MCGERMEERQRCGVPQLWRDAQGGCSVDVVWRAAGQLECCCELRRAERELCWGEQRGEQRGAECERVWARAGREWRQRRRCAWGVRVRGQRLGQRQRCSVQSSHGRVWRSRGGCVCWSSARQLQRAVELRRAERELSRTEQRCEQRGCERDRCGAGRGGPERRKQQGATRLDCVRRKRVAE